MSQIIVTEGILIIKHFTLVGMCMNFSRKIRHIYCCYVADDNWDVNRLSVNTRM